MPGIYIHIPFCIKKCNYCDFISYSNKAGCFFSSYTEALKKEMQIYSLKTQSCLFDTVFIGGGTPSVLEPQLIKDILNSLKLNFKIAKDAEITIEANPGTISEEKLSAYREVGINRLSLGIQSADDEILKAIGRIHTFKEAKESFLLARKCGFNNINIDIMYALPMQNAEKYKATLKEIIALSPEHISAYSLILEEGTPLYTAWKNGKVELPEDDEAYNMHSQTIKTLESFGYERYEISNYAKSGFKCRHNLNYWQNGEYLGLGVAAHSAMRFNQNFERWSNTSDLNAYIENPQHEETHEVILKEDEMFEYIMLTLRKTEGFKISEFEERFKESLESLYGEKAKRLKEKGWLTYSGEWLKLTSEGLDMQNEALIELLY